MHYLTLLFCLLFPLIASAEWKQVTFNAMGTRAEIELWQSDDINADALFSMAQNEVSRLEKLLSPYIESSEISRVNREAGKGVSISAETYEIIRRSLHYSELTNGAFDISFASVGRHYSYRDKQAPSAEQTQAFVKAINYRDIALTQDDISSEKIARDKNHVSQYSVTLKKKNMAIDLGGIAKGYTIDRIAALLSEHKVKSAAISLGGDAYYLGDRGPVVTKSTDQFTTITESRRIPWVIGIKHPRQISNDKNRQRNDYALRIPIVNTAFSTSGDYERYFIDEKTGERIHHIIDPTVGKSAGELASVSVIGPKSIDCDALSTSLFVLGVEKGLALIETLPDYDAIIIDRSGKVYYSSGLGE